LEPDKVIKRRRFTDEDKALALRLHRMKWSYARIARHIGRDRKATYEMILREINKPLPKRHEAVVPSEGLFWKPTLAMLMGRR
jgi:transposase-like protein